MPGPVTIELGTPSPRSSFEEIQPPAGYSQPSYLHSHPHGAGWSTDAPVEELPMHYIADEKARRRIVRPAGPGSSPLTSTHDFNGHSLNDGGLGDGGDAYHDGYYRRDDGISNLNIPLPLAHSECRDIPSGVQSRV